MNEIQKFLKKLTKKERELLIKQILPQIISGEWSNLDLKKMKGKKNLYRVRQGNIRIVFLKQNEKVQILKVAFRKDVY